MWYKWFILSRLNWKIFVEYIISYVRENSNSISVTYLNSENLYSAFRSAILHLHDKGYKLDLLGPHEIKKRGTQERLFNEMTDLHYMFTFLVKLVLFLFVLPGCLYPPTFVNINHCFNDEPVTSQQVETTVSIVVNKNCKILQSVYFKPLTCTRQFHKGNLPTAQNIIDKSYFSLIIELWWLDNVG